MTHNTVQHFVSTGKGEFPAYVAEAGKNHRGAWYVTLPPISDAEVGRNIRSFGSMTQPVRLDPQRPVEVAATPSEQSHLFVTTANAGLRTTDNLLELAVRGVVAAKNGEGMAYVAPDGNSGTDGTTAGEALEYALTGSWLQEDMRGQFLPAPIILAIRDALARRSVQPHRLSSTGHGGIYATALATILPENSVTSVTQSLRPGLLGPNLSRGLRAQAVDQLQQTSDTLYTFSDPWDGSTEHGAHILNSYLPPTYTKSRLPVRSPFVALAHLVAGRSSGLPSQNLVRDSIAMLQRQPHADLTFVIAESDTATAGAPHTREGRIKSVLSDLSLATTGRVAVVTVPGTRNALTHAPSLMAALPYGALKG